MKLQLLCILLSSSLSSVSRSQRVDDDPWGEAKRVDDDDSWEYWPNGTRYRPLRHGSSSVDLIGDASRDEAEPEATSTTIPKKVNDNSALFFAPKPKDIFEGVIGAVTNVVWGVPAGIVTFVGLLWLGYMGGGFQGLVIGGIAGSICSLVVLVLTAVQVLYQLIMGLLLTPSSVRSYWDGEVWDPRKREWLQYRIAEEANELQQAQEPSFPPLNSSLYDLLGVPTNATVNDVKKAYYARAKDMHPDKSDDPMGHQQFQQLHEAYNTLSSNNLRHLYDVVGVVPDDGSLPSFDAAVFVTTLLDTKSVEPWIGNLSLCEFADKIKNVVLFFLIRNKEFFVEKVNPATNEALQLALTRAFLEGSPFRQRHRQVEVAQQLLGFMNDFVQKSSTLQDFDAACRELSRQIAASAFGSKFLPMIGNALLRQAAVYRGHSSMAPYYWLTGSAASISGWIGGWRTNGNVFMLSVRCTSFIFGLFDDETAHPAEIWRDITYGMKSDELNSHLPLLFDLIWSLVSADISETLAGACWKLLSDTSADSVKRWRRAEALSILGRAMVQVHTDACFEAETPLSILQDQMEQALRSAERENGSYADEIVE